MDINISTIRNADKLYQEVTEALGSDITVKECFFTFEYRQQQNNYKIEGRFIFDKEKDLSIILDKLKCFKKENVIFPKLSKINYVKVFKHYKYD